METNETGLTKEEKVMFSILGFILLVAIIFLIIANFSHNDRNLKETPNNNKPVTKEEINPPEEDNQEIKVDEVEEKTSDIIEEIPVLNVTNSVTKHNVVNVSNENNSKNQVNNTNSSETSNTQPDIQVEEKITWIINENVITEAFENDVIEINNTVNLSNGQIANALVTVRKLENDTYNIVDTTNNRFVATEGIYRYYYTYDNTTKEIELIVKKRLENIDITPLTNSIYQENIEFTEEEYNNIIKNSNNTIITKKDHLYEININQTTKTNVVALSIFLNDKIDYVNTSSPSITIGSSYKEMWNEDYENGRLRFLIRTDEIISNEIIKLEVNYNNHNYVLELLFNINVNIDEQQPTEQPEEEQTKQPEKNPTEDIEKNPSEEIDDLNNKIEEETKTTINPEQENKIDEETIQEGLSLEEQLPYINDISENTEQSDTLLSSKKT